MKTARPFSTISYNTDKKLEQTLGELIKKDVICFYAYIEHFPEEDEKKKHKHLYIVPNGQQQTDQIRKLLEEADPDNPLLPPLGCIDMVSSKFDDWYLYGLHDPCYLESKNQKRKHFYNDDDFKTSNQDSFREKISRIDFSKYRKTQDFVNAIMSGVTFFDMVQKGQVPAPQFMQWKQLYDFVSGHMKRNGRETHTPITVDPDTGEIIETE